MNAHLKLVSDHPIAVRPGRLNGRELHQLSDMLTAEVQAGRPEAARFLAALQKLSPFAIAIIASWMSKAGLSEAQILNVVI